MSLFAEFFVDVVAEEGLDAGFGLLGVYPRDFCAGFVEEGGGGGEVVRLGDGFVEVDFGFDAVGGHVGFELVDVALALGDGGKIAGEVVSAGVAGGVEPFGLISEDKVAHFLPVALETGSLDSRGGGDGIWMATDEREDAEDNGEVVAEFFGDFVHPGVDGGTTRALIVGVFIDDDLGFLEVALDVVGDLAVVVVGFDKLGCIVLRKVDRGGGVARFFGDLRDDDDGADENSDNDNKRNEKSAIIFHEDIVA